MQNVKILIETDELISVLDAAKELSIHFTTVYRWIKKGKVFSFSIHGVDYLHTSEVQALKNKMHEGQEIAS